MMGYEIKGRASHATPERVERFVKLIDEIRKRNMNIDDMADGIGMSVYGVSKYIQDMRRNDVIHSVGCVDGRHIYRINPREHIVKAFVDALQAPGKAHAPHHRGKKVDDVFGSVHVMDDDAAYRIKRLGNKIPEHEPLMAYFFGMVAA